LYRSVAFDYPLTKNQVQQKDTSNNSPFTDLSRLPTDGRIIALDPGTKRIGIAVSDELRITTRPLPRILRKSWKKLLLDVKNTIEHFDAKALVVGLPLESDGGEGEMTVEARRLARNFALSLEIPVFMQDERVTSYEAKGRLWEQGRDLRETRALVDSEAAAIILSDFIDRLRSQ
jgi:putative holliday junction resolvase